MILETDRENTSSHSGELSLKGAVALSEDRMHDDDDVDDDDEEQ